MELWYTFIFLILVYVQPQPKKLLAISFRRHFPFLVTLSWFQISPVTSKKKLFLPFHAALFLLFSSQSFFLPPYLVFLRATYSTYCEFYRLILSSAALLARLLWHSPYPLILCRAPAFDSFNFQLGHSRFKSCLLWLLNSSGCSPLPDSGFSMFGVILWAFGHFLHNRTSGGSWVHPRSCLTSHLGRISVGTNNIS